MLFKFVKIGHWNCFGFDFHDTRLKIALIRQFVPTQESPGCNEPTLIKHVLDPFLRGSAALGRGRGRCLHKLIVTSDFKTARKSTRRNISIFPCKEIVNGENRFGIWRE